MEMNHPHVYIIIIICSIIVWYGCEEPFIPDTREDDQQIVVEGYIEYGENSNFTFVLLTKSLPFIGIIDDKVLESIFVHGAEVKVNSYGETVQLDELCLNQLPPEIKKEAAVLLGLDPERVNVNICAYVDLFDKIKKREGGLYDLEIKIGDKILTSSTTVPEYIPLYGFRWEAPPGKPNDSLATLYARVDDPPNVENYYRYLTGLVNEPLQSPFASVTNDVFFDGKSFEFILNKAEPRGSDIDPETFGLYRRGDSMVIKWSTLDKEHFDFWSTLEFSANRNGPFASYTRVSSNIEGGQGIWGGYAVGYYYLKVPE
jgi:hypothetical protein